MRNFSQPEDYGIVYNSFSLKTYKYGEWGNRPPRKRRCLAYIIPGWNSRSVR
jgi:hypothetical protein